MANIHLAPLSDYFQILNEIVIKYYIIQKHINSKSDCGWVGPSKHNCRRIVFY